jgi:hypothetical protein
VRLLVEMKSDCECCWGTGDAQGELIQFRGAFLLRRAFRLNSRARDGGAKDLRHFAAPGDARKNLRLAVEKRGVVGKRDPHRYARTVGLLGGNEQTAARDVDGFS